MGSNMMNTMIQFFLGKRENLFLYSFSFLIWLQIHFFQITALPPVWNQITNHFMLINNHQLINKVKIKDNA